MAAAAGVAPDVVRRYYANREALFAAAMPSAPGAGQVITLALAVILVGSTVTVVRRVLRIARELRSHGP